MFHLKNFYRKRLKNMIAVPEKRKKFHGRVALITGGSRGIGRAIALALAERGAHVVFSYFRRRGDALETEKELSSKGVETLSVRGNMGNAEHIGILFDETKKKFRHLDFVVHNAATGDLKPLMEITEEEWDRTQDINVKALLLLAQRAAPLMKGRQGRFLSISSHGSFRCLPNYGALGAAKAAAESLTRYLAAELAPHGITANTVLAGTTDTVSLRGIPGHERLLHEAKDRTPLGRIGTPEDIAKVAAFLCSEDAQWIVGQTIIADGGFSILV
jgi:enoyl-[acyl-carrier protein] reductase III